MKQQVLPLGRQKDLVVRELKGELLIYDLKINKAYCLNESSALVYQLCDGNNSTQDISRSLSKKLQMPIGEDFVWLALNELKKENLLDNSLEIETKFEGLSRREVIRKIGFASMVALPAISSLVAPTAAMAQSACVNPGGLPPGSPTITICAGGDQAACNSLCSNSSFATNQCCSGQATAEPGCSPTGGCYCICV